MKTDTKIENKSTQDRLNKKLTLEQLEQVAGGRMNEKKYKICDGGYCEEGEA